MLGLSSGEWNRVMKRGGGSTELRKELGFWSNIDGFISQFFQLLVAHRSLVMSF